MFTENNLVAFGNYLLKRYNVQEFSTDGSNTPLFQRQISDADYRNWMSDSPIEERYPRDRDGNIISLYPSRFRLGSRVYFISMPDDETITEFPRIPAEILAVHFYPGKVKYDLDLLFVGDQRSRIYNVDSALVEARE